MKLYEVPRYSKIRVISDIEIPPSAPDIIENDILDFHYIDGMYSFCKDKDGNIVHLVAWAEVEVIE